MADNPNPARITAAMWRLWTDRPVAAWLLGGIYADKRGYHNTRAANQARWPGNYSITLPLDRQGPSDKAAAIDYTMAASEMRRRTGFLIAAADRRDPRLFAVREFYGTTDGANVHGRIKDSREGAWRRAVSDSSHLWHIHISFLRAYVNVWAELAPVLSVLRGETLAQWQAAQDTEGDRMSVEDARRGAIAAWRSRRSPEATVARAFPGVRDDGYLRDTWLQYAYMWARRAAERWAGKVLPNAWMARRWNIPAEGWSRDVWLRSGYGHARAAHDNTVALIEAVAQQAAELRAIRDLLGQVLDRAGATVDMAAVEAAARAGAQEVVAQLDLRVADSPEEEPTVAGFEPDENDSDDT